ncbi:TRAP transporter large permease subunit [Actinophytocola sp.]|uniref:TRAP transporter large permease n=1 Tax=Actinophytocola sp. TaxID=1872138 RepID=UPI003D6B9449
MSDTVENAPTVETSAVVGDDESAATTDTPHHVRLLTTALSVLCGVLLLGEALFLFFTVVYRHFAPNAIVEANEIASVGLVGLGVLGSGYAYVRGGHISLNIFADRWPVRLRPVISAVSELSVLAFSVICGFYAIRLASVTESRLPVSRWLESVLYVPVAAGAAITAVVALIRLADIRIRDVLGGVAVTAVLAVAFVASAAGLTGEQGKAVLGLGAVLFLILMFLGIPLAFVFGIVGSLLLLVAPHPPNAVIIPQELVAGMNSFILLALPLFLLTGGMLASGGVSERLLNIVGDVAGRVRGGSGMAAVAAMYLVSGLSGAKIADIAAVAPVAKPAMRASGHDDGEVVGVLNAGAVMGETIPPSLAMLVLASVSSVSTTELFKAGLLPAATVGLILMVAIYIRAVRANIRPAAEKPTWRQVRRHAASAILPLGMPAIVFVGIIGGFATPVEAGSMAVVYGLLLLILVYRVKTASTARVVAREASQSGMLLFLLGTSSILVHALNIYGIPQDVAALASTFDGDKILFLFVSFLALVVLGSIMEGLPAIVIMAPLLFPISATLGIEPLHYGIVLLLSMGLGAFLPPFGIAYYTTCAMVGIPPQRAIRATIVYDTVLVIAILLIIFVPSITLVVVE